MARWLDRLRGAGASQPSGDAPQRTEPAQLPPTTVAADAAVGGMLGDQGRRYPSLAAAREDPDAAVILTGDFGGQVFLTAPVTIVRADQSMLERLLERLDAIAWPTNDSGGRSLQFVHAPVGNGVVGGMGGARIEPGVWVHDGFHREGLADGIVDIVMGRSETLPGIARKPQIGQPYRSAKHPAWGLVFHADGTALRDDGATGTWSGADHDVIVTFDGRSLAAMAIADVLMIEPEPGAGVMERPIMLERVRD